MKQIFLLPVFVLLFSTATPVLAQSDPDGGTKPATGEKVLIFDKKIDNMEYWMRLAKKGLVPYNPDIAVPPATYKGSAIESNGVKIADSPDIPVSSATNITESENSVFVDPDNNQYLLNSNNSTDWTGSSVGSVYGANYFQTSDGGATYVGTAGGAGGTNRGDPTTAINRAGRQFVNYISSSSGQGVAYSDNGTTWSTATVGPNPGSLADKNHMWIDNSLSSPYQNNLYTAWTDFGGTYNYQVVFSRSTDNGVTWSTRSNISGLSLASFNHGVNLQTGPNGEVYAVWATYSNTSTLYEDGLGFNKSTDGGATFGTPTAIITNIKGVRGLSTIKSHRVNSFPVMAVDVSGGPNNGNLYVVWSNIGVPGTNTGTNKSVYMIRSSDGGTTWSTPIRVNQGPLGDAYSSYEAWITCDPETGTLAVIFYDDRNATSTTAETWVAYSVDAGNNWTDFRVSDVSFTPAPISGLASNYMGDYLGITSKGGRVYPCWIDTRDNKFMTYISPFMIGLNAGFNASSTSVCSGSSVTFTNLSSGPPTTWTWSFPGGTPSSYVGQNPPAVVYNTPGTYDVTLVVTDGSGSDTETKTGYITVKDVFADFSANPTSVFITNSTSFTNHSLCSPTTCTWSFPGGTPSSYVGTTPPAITYNTVGTYDVSLTVTKGSSTDTKTRTGYITVLPPEFVMNNLTVSTCTGNFYDPGGASAAYSDGTDYTMTFNPGTAGSFLRFIFSSFDLEANSTCSYDYLKIYDGNSTAATLIGTYCGTTSPGTVLATNATGSLTFVFHSDESVTASGWAASISCVTGIVVNPGNFAATAASSSQINLSWTQNPSGQDVMIAWAPNSTFGTPVNGTSYSAGSAIAGGGTVLYRGPLTAFSHTGLTSNTAYYYKAFSFDAGNNYSTGSTANAATPCGSYSLPFSEVFATSALPACWTKQQSGTGATDKWAVVNSAIAGGTAYEMRSTYQSVNPGVTRLVTPPLNTVGVTQLALSFRHMLDAYSTGCNLRIQSSTDKVNWTNETWTVAATATNIAATQVNTTVSNNLNSPTTYLAFEIDGNLFNYDYWYIDNVTVNAQITFPIVSTAAVSSITTTTAQSGGNVTSLGGAPLTARGVCWSTSENPTIADSHTTDGADLGTFTSSITGLLPNTLYHVRAYATNTTGTGYGQDVQFTTEASLKSVNLNVLLEGLYAGSGVMNQAQDENGPHWASPIADKVTIELHDAANYGTVVYTASNISLTTSGLVAFTVPAQFNGSYYITIVHRNSVLTVSALPVSFAGSTVSYAFSNQQGRSYGDNMLAMEDGVYVVYSGDCNQDGSVDTADFSDLDNDSSNFLQGYYTSDLNGDSFIDSGDMTLLDNNSAQFIYSMTP